MSLAGRGVYQLLQVGDEVLQLWHLDVALNHVAWVEVSDSIDELLECIIVLFLFIEVVGMLLRYFSDDLLRKLSSLRYLLSLSE